MTNFNCECEDTNNSLTLAQYRSKMFDRLGFAAVKSNPPPGMEDLLNTFLQDAQNHLYLEYPALRTRRFFRWRMQEGERFYGLLDNDENWTDAEVTVSVATPGVVTFTGDAPPNGRLISFTVEDGGELPTGITAYHRYYVVNSAGSTCNIALTANGTAIATTGTTSGQITASYSPASTCVFDFSPYSEIMSVWMVLPNNIWLPMGNGIPPSFYTTEANGGIPSRYEIRQCIEVFPAPDGPGYALYIKGHFGLRSFTEDADKATIDGELVYLWALGNAKAHYGQPDASLVGKQAGARLRNLIAGTHGTRRYIPGQPDLPPAVMPVFLPLNGAPP